MVNKQPINITFGHGLDQKTDPLQVQVGKFLSLKNSIFDKFGRLAKRNGFGALATLPDTTSTFATTFNGNLTAIGSNLQAYSEGSNSWVNKGAIQPAELSTLPVIRSNTNQSQADTAVAPNGLMCTVFTDNIPTSGSNVAHYKYVVADSTTGQNVIAPIDIPVSSGAIVGSPRVFVLGNFFIIVFSNLISATNHLQYIAVSIYAPTTVKANTDISALYTPSSGVSFDGVVVNNSLYLAWAGSDGSVKLTYLDRTLTLHNTVSFASQPCTLMSVTADSSGSTPVIYASYYDSGTSAGKTLSVNAQLGTVHAPVSTITAETVVNITSTATAGVCTIFYEINKAYSYDSAIRTDYIESNTITQAGTVGTKAVMARSVGLASKAFILGGKSYMLSAYSSSYQPTFFLLNSSGQVIVKLAYSNGGGYVLKGLPSVTVTDLNAQFAYLIKDLLQATNRTQGSTAAPIYTQTGINLASVTITTQSVITAEIGNSLHLTGGFLWDYDGYSAVENNFHVWPDDVEVTTATGSGHLTAQQYYYQVIYEWTDNQGNIQRSAPSLPVGVVTTTATSTNTVNIPTLRLTYKTSNPVKLVVYRWSAAQQTYYQVSSISIPTLNDPTVDSIAFVDSLADSSILGNSIIYTTGGVIENIGCPAVSAITLYKSRLLALSAEDPNLLLYSKQVIENTPVEMSDLFTLYVAPTAGAQGSTGNLKCLSAMDDKAILFKKDAIYYLTGSGPDNAGANNDLSEPTFITSTVGSENQKSIVFVPQGLMFQSDKGIWMLGRDLSTTYIGAPVQDYTDGATVLSAVNVPGTNEVRFTLDSGITLMYDYYYGQWGTFENIPAISSTLYKGLHTYINASGKVFQETPGKYLDGSKPVLISFTTAWVNLSGLQGFQRAYHFYMLGTYITPHKLAINIAYDYDSNPTQSVMVMPDNYAPAYGADSLYGGSSPYGGSSVEQNRVFLERQKCQAFQLTISEIFDASFGVTAGAGFTMSGINLIVGAKKGSPTLRPSRSFG